MKNSGIDMFNKLCNVSSKDHKCAFEIASCEILNKQLINLFTSIFSIKLRPETEQPLAATSSALKSSAMVSGGDASCKMPPPLMSSRDMTSASLEETVINGQVIPCFNIGGEMRLCFPQILKQILGSFQSEQICLACEELLIHVAPASTQQLVVLKGAGVLPLAAHQCGLITKSDAERLAAYLMTNKMTAAAANNNNNSLENNNVDQLLSDELSDHRVVVYVQHECFGRATGSLYPALYRDPKAKCINCTTCGKIFEFYI